MVAFLSLFFEFTSATVDSEESFWKTNVRIRITKQIPRMVPIRMAWIKRLFKENFFLWERFAVPALPTEIALDLPANGVRPGCGSVSNGKICSPFGVSEVWLSL